MIKAAIKVHETLALAELDIRELTLPCRGRACKQAAGLLDLTRGLAKFKKILFASSQ